MADSGSQGNNDCVATTLQTILVGSGIIIFLLWWNRKNDTKSVLSGREGGEKESHLDTFVQDISPVKTPPRFTESKQTQTSGDGFTWNAVFVGNREDEFQLRHRSELKLDFRTGDVTRSEEVLRSPSNYVLTKVG